MSLDLKTKKAQAFVVSFEDYSGKKLSYEIKEEILKQNNEWEKIKKFGEKINDETRNKH